MTSSISLPYHLIHIPSNFLDVLSPFNFCYMYNIDIRPTIKHKKI